MHPILFHIGSIPVRSYGALIVIGFLIGLWRAMRVCARRWATEPADSPRRIHPDVIFDIGFWGLIVGILGARLLFVALDWKSFAGRPLEALKFWEGGLSLHGGMLFGILFLIIACRIKKVSVLAAGDLCGTSWALAYAIGRIGCFLNGCCYGGPCDPSLPWASRFPDERYAQDQLNPTFSPILTPPSHPVQLYATVINLIFFALMVQWEKRRRADGELFYGYIGLYGFYRYLMEFFRGGATSTYAIPQYHITDTHIISVIMMAIAIVNIIRLRRRGPLYQDAVQS
jgi:phosphatidylglycerol:prolipoprotein diacylglycerol transferase